MEHFFPSGRFTWSTLTDQLLIFGRHFAADTDIPSRATVWPTIVHSDWLVSQRSLPSGWKFYQAAVYFVLWNLRIWPIYIILVGVAGMVFSVLEQFYHFIRIACTASLLVPSPYNWLSITIEMTFSSRPGRPNSNRQEGKVKKTINKSTSTLLSLESVLGCLTDLKLRGWRCMFHNSKRCMGNNRDGRGWKKLVNCLESLFLYVSILK